MTTAILITLAVLLGAMIYCAVKHEGRRIPQKRARFAGRESVSLDSIFDEHYRSSGIPKDRFVFLWNQVAQTLKLDAEKLRPSDSFEVELAPVKGHITPDEIGDLIEFSNREWKKLGNTSAPPRISSLDLFIQTYAKKSDTSSN